MKLSLRALFLSVIILSAYNTFGQVEVGVLAGTTLYGGDMSKTPFVLEEAKPAGAVFGEFKIGSKFGINGSLLYGKISGDDLNVEGTYKRNLRFESNVFEFAVKGSYDILDPVFNRVVPYAYAGAALFHHNPTTELEGETIELQPLGTEGQGLEGNAAPYSLWAFSVPLGGGVKYQLNDEIQLRADFGARMTFTDYLDDLSGPEYADPQELLEGNGEIAYQLAYRGDEIDTDYPDSYSEFSDEEVRNKFLRSSGEYNDWYYLFGIGASYTFGGSKSKIPKNRKGVPYSYSRY